MPPGLRWWSGPYGWLAGSFQTSVVAVSRVGSHFIGPGFFFGPGAPGFLPYRVSLCGTGLVPGVETVES